MMLKRSFEKMGGKKDRGRRVGGKYAHAERGIRDDLCGMEAKKNISD
jgi:hypothetical protein